MNNPQYMMEDGEEDSEIHISLCGHIVKNDTNLTDLEI